LHTWLSAEKATFATFIYEKAGERLLRQHFTGSDQNEVIRQALVWYERFCATKSIKTLRPGSEGKPNSRTKTPIADIKPGEQRDIEHRFDQAGSRVSFLPGFHGGSLRARGFDREGIVCL
jgi:hypothetical protein